MTRPKEISFQFLSASFGQFILQNYMIAMIEVERQYIGHLDKWCKEGVSEAEQGLNNFIQRIKTNFDIQLTYDNHISSAIKRLLNNFEYTEYSQKQQHKNQLKNNLRKIARVLFIESFISIEDYQKLTNAISSSYLSKDIDKFIEMVAFQQRELSQHEIETFWKNSLRRNFQYTWTFLNRNKILDEKIIKLFEICQPIIKKCSLQRIQEINDYHDRIKRIQFAKILRIKDINVACLESKNDYNIKIDKFITPKCLFLNKIMLKKAIQQINGVVKIILDKNFEDGINYDLYGSLRTGFAIIFHSDADITINYENKQQATRQSKIMRLQDIYQTLKNEEDNLDYFKIQLLASSRIRNPLVKMNFDIKKDYKQRSPLCSIDILIDSPIGVQNSKILELYSKSIPIMKLVCLIKYWAKRKNLISPKRFSSFGITLMVLYFLIKTNQAPYIIKISQSYRLQKALLPEKQFTPILDNFIAFLDFYRYQGCFFTQKKPVCLMQTSGIQTPDNILINMYDFIDGSNPGRVTRILEQKFFTTINKTIQKLRLCIDLSDVMSFQE